MSDKPVLERLQVKRERKLAVIGLPEEVSLPGSDAVAAAPEVADVVLVFVPTLAEFEQAVPPLLARIGPEAILWVAYPKLTSALAGDLNRDVIHQRSPAMGIDCVSQIALDATWSAMRMKRLS